MGSFHGKYDYSIDAKGRVNIPAKFRKALTPAAGDTFIIVRAPGKCLRAYPKDVWEVCGAELSARPDTPENITYKRMLFSTLSDSTLDTHGRITLTPAQMQVAGIAKDVTLVGMESYIELWDMQAHQQLFGMAGGDAADDFDAAFYNSVKTGLVGQ